MSVIAHNLGAIGAGLGTTLVIALLAYAGALLAGTLIAVCRVSPIPPLRAVSTVWVTLACNIPTLCLMILLAFAAPQAGVHFSLFAAAVSAILFAGSGFVCEAVRSGINSVAKGQIEAARALGMPFGLIIRAVVLPQALARTVQPLVNIFIACLIGSNHRGARAHQRHPAAQFAIRGGRSHVPAVGSDLSCAGFRRGEARRSA